MSLASLITGIGALVFCGLGVVIGPVAVILGFVARSRSRSDGKALAGIITGAVATVLSVVAIAAAVVIYTDQRDHDDRDRAAAQDAAETVLTEDGVADAGYATAYEAWDDAYDARGAFNGMYDGDDIDTPCYTLGGEAWWVSSSNGEACDGESELWWEEYSGTAEREIKLFGSGGVGAAIIVDAVPANKAADLFDVQTLDGATDYVTGTMLPDAGLTDFEVSETTISGSPAVAVDATSPRLEDFRIYVLQAPQPYDSVGGVEFFIVTVYNEVGWVNSFEDVVARFEETFAWE